MDIRDPKWEPLWAVLCILIAGFIGYLFIRAI